MLLTWKMPSGEQAMWRFVSWSRAAFTAVMSSCVRSRGVRATVQIGWPFVRQAQMNAQLAFVREEVATVTFALALALAPSCRWHFHTMISSSHLLQHHQQRMGTPTASKDVSEDNCVICLSSVTERAIAVPCNHYSFDFVCLVSWLQERSICPLCELSFATRRRGKLLIRTQVKRKSQLSSTTGGHPKTSKATASAAHTYQRTRPQQSIHDMHRYRRHMHYRLDADVRVAPLPLH